MSLQRLGIRNALAEILMDHTAAEGRISTNPAEEVWKGDLPAIGIYTVTDGSRIFEEGPRVYERALEVDFELYVRRSDGVPLDEDADTLAQQVFNLVEVNLRALCALFEANYGKSGLGGEELDFRGDGSKPLAGSRMRWVFVYHQTRPGDAAAITPLLGADVEWEVPSSATDEREALDAIDTPQ